MSDVTTMQDRRYREWTLEGDENDKLEIGLWANGSATVTVIDWDDSMIMTMTADELESLKKWLNEDIG